MNPAELRPQLVKTPTTTSISAAEAIRSKDWIVQKKWDGMRVLIHVMPEEGVTLIYSRTGQDVRDQFPELTRLHEDFDGPAILDGEVVAMDPNRPGMESLELLQMRSGDKKARRRDDIPVDIVFFDVLAAQVDGVEFDGGDHPYSERLAFLKKMLKGTGHVTPQELTGNDTVSPDWEGVVAKKADSLYKTDKRTSEQLKFKATKRATVRATGLTPGKGSRSNHFGAITVEDEEGNPRGQIGSGFSDTQIAEIEAMDIESERPLMEVEYRFLGKNGLMVNTAYKGLRTDKNVADSADEFVGSTPHHAQKPVGKMSYKELEKLSASGGVTPENAEAVGQRMAKLKPPGKMTRSESQSEPFQANRLRREQAAMDARAIQKAADKKISEQRAKRLAPKAKKRPTIKQPKGTLSSPREGLPAHGPLTLSQSSGRLTSRSDYKSLWANWRRQPRDPNTGRWIDS